MMQATQIVGFHTDAFAGVDHRLQLVGGAQGQMPAMIHDENAVADLLDLLHVVARVHDRRTRGVELLDAFEDRVAALRVDGDGRLVEEDQLGFVHDAARDVETAQQAPRELARAEATVVVEADERDRLVDEAAAARAVGDVQRAEIGYVLLDRQLVEHGDVLRDDADAALELVARRPHRLAEDADLARIVGEQAEDAVDRRRLAGAVRSEQSVDLAAAHLQVEVVEGELVAVVLDELLDGDGGGGVRDALRGSWCRARPGIGMGRIVHVHHNARAGGGDTVPRIPDFVNGW